MVGALKSRHCTKCVEEVICTWCGGQPVNPIDKMDAGNTTHTFCMSCWGEHCSWIKDVKEVCMSFGERNK